jgi:hypothetical protein
MQINTAFGQSVHVGFSRTEIATLNGVIEHSKYGVTIVFVVLASVYTALCGHGVSAPGCILKAKAGYLVTHLSQRSSQRTAG